MNRRNSLSESLFVHLPTMFFTIAAPVTSRNRPTYLTHITESSWRTEGPFIPEAGCSALLKVSRSWWRADGEMK